MSIRFAVTQPYQGSSVARINGYETKQ